MGRSLWLRGFPAVSFAPVWLGWLGGRVNRRSSSGRRRPKSRCVALLRAVLCCAVLRLRGAFLRRGHGSRTRRRRRRASAGLFFLAFPALPCPFLFCLFDLRYPLPALDPIHPPFSSLTSAWNETTRPDRRGRSLTTSDRLPACAQQLHQHLHIASPVRHSLHLLYRCSLAPAKSRVLRTITPYFFNC